jgi:hypothetical protein
MAAAIHRLTVAIPTYRRPGLLARFLGELMRQTRMPDRLIVVDGEGGSQQVRDALEDSGWPGRAEVVLVPSTRANLPFQRWVARRLAGDSDALIFFDDDLLLPDRRTVAKLASALECAAAATCEVDMPADSERRLRFRTERLPLLPRLRAGKLGAGGARHAPLDDGSPLPTVKWLRGAAMAFRCGALPPDRFPFDLFALAEAGASMGEELALARCVRGRIALVRGLAVTHPDAAPSQVLAARSEGQGFAVAYSRRLLNDLCRDDRPALIDRTALAWSWAGGLAAAGMDWAGKGGRDRRGYALGYLHGILRGIFLPPRHSRLTPSIDWEREARLSLDAARRLGGHATGKEAVWPAISA